MAQQLDVRYVRYYTDGSAARKIAPLQPFKTMKLPVVKTQKRRTIRIDLVATAGIVMAAVMFVLLLVGACNLTKAREDAAQMESYVQTLREDNKALEEEYRSTYSLEDVQRTADALGLVPKDQVTHITLELPEEPAPEKAHLLDRFYTFLTDLFA